MSKTSRILGTGLAIFLLIGGWAYLYFKARDVALPAHNEILGHLRALKDIDNRWNDRLVGARIAEAADRAAAAAPVTNAQLSIVQHRLAVQAQTLANPMLNESMNALKDAFLAKSVAVDKFWTANQALRESLAGYNQAALSGPARGSLAVARMSAALANLLTQPNADTTRVARAVAGELDGPLATPAREVIAKKSVEETSFREALYLATGPRIDTLTRTFDREFENAILQSDIYRVYLLFYSGFLLAVLGFLGTRLSATYQVIRGMNTQLRDANEGLEVRVTERTKELSRALAQLKESEALLIQSEKMSSLGQMVAGVAHEVNTPLAYVKSSLESVSTQMPRFAALQDETGKLLGELAATAPDEHRLAAQFQAVKGSIDSLRADQTVPELQSLVGDGLHGIGQISELVTNLRNFARLDRSKMAEFDLNEGIESALVIAKNMVKHRRLERRFGAVPKVQCSPSQINQVFLNLITNAAQATAVAHGSIVLRTGSADPTTAFFEVEDNGHGIPADVLPKIFDPFFTTKEVGKGTGLGLSIVYKIIEQHGGRIDVASKVGQGTRFTVTLPVRAPHHADETAFAGAVS